MLKDHYVIHVTKTTKELDGKWLVIFVTEETQDRQLMTICTILHEPSIQPYAGCSLKHPKDKPDDYRGMHESFKRAVEALVNEKFPYSGWTSELIIGVDPKQVASRFRGAFWIAIGRPGYKKNELFPQESINKLKKNFGFTNVSSYEGE